MMACPTCDHTMQRIGSGDERVFWCPRCGTLAGEDSGLGTLNYEAPKLVERCREFERSELTGPEWSPTVSAAKVWHRLGIAESINKPEDRPKT